MVQGLESEYKVCGQVWDQVRAYAIKKEKMDFFCKIPDRGLRSVRVRMSAEWPTCDRIYCARCQGLGLDDCGCLVDFLKMVAGQHLHVCCCL